MGHRLRLLVGGSPAPGYSPSFPRCPAPSERGEGPGEAWHGGSCKKPYNRVAQVPTQWPLRLLGSRRRPKAKTLPALLPALFLPQSCSGGKADTSAGGPPSGPGSAFGGSRRRQHCTLVLSSLTAGVTGLRLPFESFLSRVCEIPLTASCTPAEADGSFRVVRAPAPPQVLIRSHRCGPPAGLSHPTRSDSSPATHTQTECALL